MLQNTYQTKVPLRCWYLQHRIPLSSFLTLLLVVMVSVLANALVRNTCYAAGPTASLELSTNKLTGQGTNETAIMANTKVTVNVSSANTYALTLKMDKLELTNGNTTIAPGNAVSDNTWGYKWEEESAYNTPQANGNNLAVPGLTNYAASFSKNLVFAAKFSKDAEAGHYKTSGVLSLVATPATTTYTITYDANGGSGAPSSQSVNSFDNIYNFTVAAKGDLNVDDGAGRFLGWAESPDSLTVTYEPDSNIQLTAEAPSRTLYAVWGKYYNLAFRGCFPEDGFDCQVFLFGNNPSCIIPRYYNGLSNAEAPSTCDMILPQPYNSGRYQLASCSLSFPPYNGRETIEFDNWIIGLEDEPIENGIQYDPGAAFKYDINDGWRYDLSIGWHHAGCQPY